MELARSKASSATRYFKRSKQRNREEYYGKKAEVKTFYENPSDDYGAQQWVEWAPPTLPEVRKLKWEGFAIQVYKSLDQSANFNNVATFRVSHILLLSPYIRAELKDVLEKYGVAFDVNHAKINWPLQPLYFARDKIAELAKTAKEEEARNHLELLCRVIDEELGTKLDEIEELENENQITHALIWTLFPKGTIVVTKENGIERGYRVLETHYNYNYQDFDMDCESVRFDGVRFGYLTRKLHIRAFEGKKAITSLEAYPLGAADDPESIRKRWMDRGRQVLDLQSIHYMLYLNMIGGGDGAPKDGRAADMWGDNVHARVIIDFYLYAKRNGREAVKPLPGYRMIGNEELSGTAAKQAQRRRRRDYDPYRTVEEDPAPKDASPDLDRNRRPNAEEQQRNRDVVLKDEDHLLIMSPELDGFSLASKTWRTFNVERISQLELTSEAYNHLVHPEGSKDLVCSLVENHKVYASSEDDVIAGKGQGLLILLSGSTGTGKTLMAEAIADKTRSPIYYVDAQDLGTSTVMDKKLADIMADAAEWNALLLLDEADVYLQERSVDSIQRNEVVSIFLRRLEYYKGTMFLTTNLFDSIDRAVESRIHVHLQFPELPWSARAKVWDNFLKRVPEDLCKLEPNEIEKLGRWHLNGRDIKNALKMTAAWCREKNKPMDFQAFEDVISITCPRATKEDEEMPKPNGVKKQLANGVAEADQPHTKWVDDLLDM